MEELSQFYCPKKLIATRRRPSYDSLVTQVPLFVVSFVFLPSIRLTSFIREDLCLFLGLHFYPPFVLQDSRNPALGKKQFQLAAALWQLCILD